MGESAVFRSEDRIAIPIAIALHVGVVAVLLLQPVRDDVLEIPQRMTVSLASEVSLESTAPNPVPESRAAIAPVLGEELGQVNEDAPAEIIPDTAPPQPTTRRNTASPASPERSRPRPERPAREPSTARASESGGGSRIGDDFLPGAGSSIRTDTTSAPAATFGSAERAALSSAITRQLRRHWTAPNGVDAERLVSIVRWQLNEDGSLKRRPTCNTVSSSITDSNRPQASLHCERAIRAVQLAAPFDLPGQFYSRWDDLEWQFDRRL